MEDRKRLKEAIKTVIKKEMKGRGILDYDIKPAVDDISYEGGSLKPFIALAKYLFKSANPDAYKNLSGRGNFGYEIPEFEEEPKTGSGIKDAKVFYDFGKALFDGVKKDKKGKSLIAEGVKRRERKKKGKSLVAEGLVAQGLVAEGMKKIGLAYRDPKGMGANAELPYSNLYGESLIAEGFNYDKNGQRKIGKPRGDRGAALKKFNEIIRKLRESDPSMTLPEARAKAKSIYRSS